MLEKEDIRNIEFKGLVINRVPDWAKLAFKARAQEEFCNDYGALLSSLMKEADEYLRLKEMFFNNQLDVKIVIENKEEIKQEKKEVKSIFNRIKKEEEK